MSFIIKGKIFYKQACKSKNILTYVLCWPQKNPANVTLPSDAELQKRKQKPQNAAIEIEKISYKFNKMHSRKTDMSERSSGNVDRAQKAVELVLVF